MRIRGERECRDCGSRWAYYETGSANCPDCGSIRSRGLDDERVLHTKGSAALDLSTVRSDVDERPPWELAANAKELCRAYVRQDGFLDGGELRPLDDAHLAARELIHVADLVGRSIDPGDDEELYLLTLLRGADQGDRPGPDEVPETLREARGLAAAEAVRAYRREMRDWREDRDRREDQEWSEAQERGEDRDRREDDALPDAEAAQARLDQVVKRVTALQGNVSPATADRLVAATRDLATAVREDDEAALATAIDRIDRLESIGED